MVKNQAFQAFFNEALPPLKRAYTSQVTMLDFLYFYGL